MYSLRALTEVDRRRRSDVGFRQPEPGFGEIADHLRANAVSNSVGKTCFGPCRRKPLDYLK